MSLALDSIVVYLCKLLHLSQVVFCNLLFAPNFQVSCKGQYQDSDFSFHITVQ